MQKISMLNKFNRLIMIGLIWVLGTAAFFNGISAPRPYYPSTLIDNRFEGLFREGEGVLMILLAVLSLCISVLYKKDYRGYWLWLGISFVYIASILSIFKGTVPKNNPVIWIMFAVYTAVFVLKNIEIDWYVTQIKRVILLYIYGSLVMMFFKPSWALEFGYSQGLIPGFNIRLHGFGVHANNLSALLVIYLMLAQIKKSRFENIHFFFIIICLLLTQSKTAWLIFGLYILLRIFYKFLDLRKKQQILALGISFITLALMLLPLLFSSVVDKLLGVFGQDSELRTLTGRTQIWEYTINAWKTNPVFGYGQDLWGYSMVNSYKSTYNWAPSHAHNQFLQTLGESGIIGAIALSIYTLILLFYAFKYFKLTKGVSLYLVAYFLIRGISEPILINQISSINLFTHFVMFSFLMVVAKSKAVKINNNTEISIESIKLNVRTT